MKINHLTPNQKNLAYYCKSFAELRKGKGYQYILLLVIIELITQQKIVENKIDISDELNNTFKKYREILLPNSGGKSGGQFNYPLKSLRNAGLLHIKFKDGIGEDPGTDIFDSIKKLKESSKYASLDDELFELIQDLDSRDKLFEKLLSELSIGFSSSQEQINKILAINTNFQSQETSKSSKTNLGERKFYLRKSLVRNYCFRKFIVYYYNRQCALCHLRVESLSQSIVDGAHIKPLSEFYDNNIDNGISLCKNHHWAFDQGLFTIDDDYRVLVYDNFKEKSPNARPLKDFSGEPIILPNSPTYYPRLEAIQWHRTNIFGNQSSS